MKSKIGTIFIIIGIVYLILMFALIVFRGSYEFMAVFTIFFKPVVFFTFGLFLKTISKAPNVMNNQSGYVKSWILISIISFYLVVFGTTFIFVCFYTSIPINPRFIFAFVYYFFGSLIISSLIYFKIKNDGDNSINSNDDEKKRLWIDSLIRILTLIFSTFCVLVGLYFSLICMSSDNMESMPGLSALFFLGSLLVVGLMVIKVKKT